jgi:hypothetical protein
MLYQRYYATRIEVANTKMLIVSRPSNRLRAAGSGSDILRKTVAALCRSGVGATAIMRFFVLGISFRTQPGSLAQPYPVPAQGIFIRSRGAA